MPPSRKNRKAFEWLVNEGKSCIVVEEEGDIVDVDSNQNGNDDTGVDVSTNANGSNNTKIKCLKCYRVARKDCTGNLCIRCCTDENCVVHQEQRAKARWKEAVMLGTTDIQLEAKRKRARVIPKRRFREQAFKYMNDTVVLWDLRTILEPPPPPQRKQYQQQPSAQPSAVVSPSGGSATTTSAAAAMVEYQNALKTREEILRRSRKNNITSSRVERATPTKTRRNYRGTKKRFRSVMEDLYQRSLA